MTVLVTLLFLIAGFLPRMASAQTRDSQLSIRIEPRYFSPNGDNLQDQVFFYPVTQGGLEVSRWRLKILKPGGRLIKRLSGPGFPSVIRWDGQDRKSKLADDGEYAAVLEIWAGKTHLSTDSHFFTDTKAPGASLTASSPFIDKSSPTLSSVRLIPDVSDDSPVDQWLIQIIDLTGHTISVLPSTGSVHPVDWNGLDQRVGIIAPSGKYRCALQVWDAAGNEGLSPFVDVELKASAQDRQGESVRDLAITKTENGLLVQLGSNQLFEMKDDKFALSDSGRALLRELAMLINTYAESPVKLDGYSSRAKKPALNRQRASLYAWTVYSELVKTGAVQPARLRVQGKGAEISPERKQVKPAAVREGVEVLVGTK